ncbi:hypothetical protein ACFV6F_03700 [Kitasatospora phosalacinea]|uniref:hypothetical protein n=1 Tax=Kitasatospora phosalacinea TaxID=2065 RepID=UPI003667F369
MSGSEQEVLPSGRPLTPEVELASADREVRHHDHPTKLARVLRKCGVVLDFVSKLAAALAGTVAALKALGLM